MAAIKLIGSLEKYLFFLIYIIFSVRAGGQILNQDASGKSAIVVQGSSINIDIAESLFKINHYGYFNDRKGIFGIDLQGKNETGLAELFKTGDFSPNADLSFLIGRSYIRVENPNKAEEDEVEEARARILPLLEAKYLSVVKNKVVGCSDQQGQPTQSTATLVADLRGVTRKGWSDVSTEIYKVISTIKEDNPACKATLITESLSVLEAIRTEPLLSEYSAILNKIDSLSKKTKEYIKNKSDICYLQGGVNALEFTLDKGNTFPLFNDRFQDTLNASFYIIWGDHFNCEETS